MQTTDQLGRARTLDVKITGESKRVFYGERYPIKKGYIEDLLIRLHPGDQLRTLSGQNIQLIAEPSPDGTLVVREIKLLPPPPSVEAER